MPTQKTPATPPTGGEPPEDHSDDEIARTRRTAEYWRAKREAEEEMAKYGGQGERTPPSGGTGGDKPRQPQSSGKTHGTTKKTDKPPASRTGAQHGGSRGGGAGGGSGAQRGADKPPESGHRWFRKLGGK